MLIYLTWELIMIITSEPDPKKVKYKGNLYNSKSVTTTKLQPQRRLIYIKVILRIHLVGCVWIMRR